MPTPDPYDEQVESDIIDSATKRRSWIERRKDGRCECGHGKFWHATDGKCLAGGEFHYCLEYRPQPDRRKL